jgi:hypothetical protein
MAYQRGQVVSALFTAFAGPFLIGAVPLRNVPRTFVRRVGNLLDNGIGIEPERRAGQKGTFQEYSEGDAVELAVALSMQNVGLPQAEIVRYLMAFRPDIRKQIALIPESAWGQSFPRFLIIRPFALGETLRQHRGLPELRGGPIAYFRPEFVSDWASWKALAEEIGKPTGQLILIEIGDLVPKLRYGLERTEISKRGRR